MNTLKSISDFKCPICLCILIKPVKPTCNHVMCLPCFEQNIEQANFTCPICRSRISSWARKAIRTNTLIDKERWREIQKRFPKQVKRRLTGGGSGFSDDEEDLSSIYSNKISKPGEIKLEFEDLLKKFNDDSTKKKDAEEKASESLIRELQEEEQQLLLQQRLKKEHTENDLKFAYQLDAILNSTVEISQTPKSRRSSTIAETITSSRNDSMRHKEEQASSNCKIEAVNNIRSASVESHDSISSEMCHFKPITAAPCTPPKRLPDGRFVEPLVVQTVAQRLDFSNSVSPKIKVQREKYKEASKSSKSAKHRESTSTASDDEELSPKRKIVIDISYKENYPEQKRTDFDINCQSTSQPLKHASARNGQSVKLTNHKNVQDSEDIEIDLQEKDTKIICSLKRKRKTESSSQTLDLAQFSETNEVSNKHIMEKLAQEEADRILAIKLQEEFDEAVNVSRNIDRRKGSGNEYCLRKKRNM